MGTRVDGTQVFHGGFYLWKLADAIALRDEKRGFSNKERDEYNAGIVATDPMYKNVPYAASNDELTVWHKKHWTTNYLDADRPMLVVRGTNSFAPACQFIGCDSAAAGDCRGGKHILCSPHGGGLRCWGVSGVAGGCPDNIAITKREKYDGMCLRCFCDANPDDPRAVLAKKHFQAKEQTTREFLKKVFPNHNWTFNKTWSRRGAFQGTLRYRPDARTTTSDRVIIVEVDEHSHASYDCGKERVREAEFVATARSMGRIVVLLRFNPDGYTDDHGKYFPTCFKLSKKGNQVTVDPAQQKQWDGRLKELADHVRFFSDPSNPVPEPDHGRPCYVKEIAYRDVAGNAAKKRSRSEY